MKEDFKTLLEIARECFNCDFDISFMNGEIIIKKYEGFNKNMFFDFVDIVKDFCLEYNLVYFKIYEIDCDGYIISWGNTKEQKNIVDSAYL